jgi:SM-20-related protein
MINIDYLYRQPAICPTLCKLLFLQKIFDTLIDSFIDSKVGVVKNFLSVSLTTHLRENLISLFRAEKMASAGMGNGKIAEQNLLVRSDKIYWLDRGHENVYEKEFLDIMDSFVLHLNNTCYTGITGYEFHYAMYEKGSFYKKHFDQFKNNNSRKYSMIIYLNEDWKDTDGGELSISHEGRSETISPENGKGVFFKSSEIEHEVLITSRPRFSITGWLKS